MKQATNTASTNSGTANTAATNDTAAESAEGNPAQPDLFGDFSFVANAVVELMAEAAALDDVSRAKIVPSCPEFTVNDLLDHIVLVVRRTAAIGGGSHWSSVVPEELGGGWVDEFRSQWTLVDERWSDPAKYGDTFEVPWGEIPGAGLLATYTGELAIHGWDLANATGLEFSIDDDRLTSVEAAAQLIPADNRDDPDMPFGPVVDPGPNASTLHRIAGWLGRPVAA